MPAVRSEATPPALPPAPAWGQGGGLPVSAATTSLLAVLSASALMGCDSATDGALGRVSFTPEHCGLPFAMGCDFDRGLTSGATVEMYIEGKEGFSSAGIDLRSETPNVAELESIADLDGRPAWRVRGLAPGRAELAVVDRDDEVVDYLRFDVRAPNYGFHVPNNTLSGPDTSEPGYDEVWQISSNHVDIEVVSRHGGDAMMGILDLDPMLSNEFSDVDLKGELREGEVEFFLNRAGLGPFDVHFTDPNGVTFRARLER